MLMCGKELFLLLKVEYEKCLVSDSYSFHQICYKRRPPVDDYAKDDGPEEVWLLCSFNHHALQA